MREDIQRLKDKAHTAKMKYHRNLIDRETAKKQIIPYAEAFNTRSKEIAKKYNQKPKLLSVAAFLR
ncbi:hypothetical protein BB699_04365 [Listeria monocytogenes]|uniref:hypothetical protein n=1 Tax=Listeria monocytogenes TaxID=1639 RepID=UPI00083CD213|nr:hypothetical protein [Listeria monocytogenes]ODD23709.1 hypothetical protein BB699_04365 [Listeria monocytogenes]